MKQRGGFVKIAAVIALAVAAILAVYYFTSDVGRTRLNEAGRQYARWTPENIAKDPENYLNFCEQECQEALLKLKASEIEIAQNRGALEAMLAGAKNKVAVGTRGLDELKDAYKQAAAGAAFPFVWNGRSYTEETAKRDIVSLHRQVEAQRVVTTRAAAGVQRLDGQVARIQEGRAKAQEQLQEIATSRSMLKVNKITDELTRRLSSIGAAVQTTAGIAADSSAPISIDQLAEQQATAVDEGEFAKIMGLYPNGVPHAQSPHSGRSRRVVPVGRLRAAAAARACGGGARVDAGAHRAGPRRISAACGRRSGAADRRAREAFAADRRSARRDRGARAASAAGAA